MEAALEAARRDENEKVHPPKDAPFEETGTFRPSV
jgi:hypothetical protein